MNKLKTIYILKCLKIYYNMFYRVNNDIIIFEVSEILKNIVNNQLIYNQTLGNYVINEFHYIKYNLHLTNEYYRSINRLYFLCDLFPNISIKKIYEIINYDFRKLKYNMIRLENSMIKCLYSDLKLLEWFKNYNTRYYSYNFHPNLQKLFKLVNSDGTSFVICCNYVKNKLT